MQMIYCYELRIAIIDVYKITLKYYHISKNSVNIWTSKIAIFIILYHLCIFEFFTEMILEAGDKIF